MHRAAAMAKSPYEKVSQQNQQLGVIETSSSDPYPGSRFGSTIILDKNVRFVYIPVSNPKIATEIYENYYKFFVNHEQLCAILKVVSQP